MSFRLFFLCSCLVVVSSLIGCKAPVGGREGQRMVATITLNSNAALPTVTGGDTLLFVYSGQAEYWVKFISTPPCAGYGEVIQFKPGQAPKCIIKTGGGATPTNITFTYGPGVYGSPLPPGGPFPARALPCKFGCP